MTNLALTIGHHLAIFALFGVLVAERALLSGSIVENLRRLRALDGAYGALALLVLLVGFLRVFFGIKGPDFYVANPIFWAKIASFVAVGLLSIVPTVTILGWYRRVSLEPGFVPDPHSVGKARSFLTAELAVFLLIPIFAAAMALGYGLS